MVNNFLKVIDILKAIFFSVNRRCGDRVVIHLGHCLLLIGNISSHESFEACNRLALILCLQLVNHVAEVILDIQMAFRSANQILRLLKLLSGTASVVQVAVLEEHAHDVRVQVDDLVREFNVVLLEVLLLQQRVQVVEDVRDLLGGIVSISCCTDGSRANIAG